MLIVLVVACCVMGVLLTSLFVICVIYAYTGDIQLSGIDKNFLRLPKSLFIAPIFMLIAPYVYRATWRANFNSVTKITVTPTEEGYWLTLADRSAIPFGDAWKFELKDIAFDPYPHNRSIIVHEDGAVSFEGKFASFATHEAALKKVDWDAVTFVVAAQALDGFWCVTDNGIVHTFGHAEFHGDMSKAPRSFHLRRVQRRPNKRPLHVILQAEQEQASLQPAP